MTRRKRRSFTPEFKAEAVRLAREGGKSVSQVAKDLDLTDSALRNWIREAEADENKSPASVQAEAEREELLRLRKDACTGRSRAPIPIHAEHRFRSKPSGHSGHAEH